MMITDRINAARKALKNMGHVEIRKSLEAGVPVSYSDTPDGAITRVYPDGRKLVQSVNEIEEDDTLRRPLGR